MAGNHRGWCGECDHHTAWVTESESEDQMLEHYLERHPGIPPGGWKEFLPNRSRGGDRGGGCLGTLAALFLLILVATTCEAQAHGAHSTDPAPSVSVSFAGERQ